MARLLLTTFSGTDSAKQAIVIEAPRRDTFALTRLMPGPLTITFEPAASAEDRDKVWRGLIAYNLQFLDDRVEHLNLFLRDKAGEIAGGLLADSYWGWLHVEAFWLDKSVRRGGWGSELLARAEAEALGRGCHAVHLDTFDFQALPFYQGQGYEVFGELGPFPGGHTRYFLKKELSPGARASSLPPSS